MATDQTPLEAAEARYAEALRLLQLAEQVAESARLAVELARQDAGLPPEATVHPIRPSREKPE